MLKANNIKVYVPVNIDDYTIFTKIEQAENIYEELAEAAFNELNKQLNKKDLVFNKPCPLIFSDYDAAEDHISGLTSLGSSVEIDVVVEMEVPEGNIAPPIWAAMSNTVGFKESPQINREDIKIYLHKLHNGNLQIPTSLKKLIENQGLMKTEKYEHGERSYVLNPKDKPICVEPICVEKIYIEKLTEVITYQSYWKNKGNPEGIGQINAFLATFNRDKASNDSFTKAWSDIQKIAKTQLKKWRGQWFGSIYRDTQVTRLYEAIRDSNFEAIEAIRKDAATTLIQQHPAPQPTPDFEF